ncbi:response regulator [Enterovirga sp. GCM10030262]|uniref:response regulator n=1 Tax=Enterovirga sp. GCM10030262 TaxID=3273391 RepID=UPI00361738A2
MSSASKILLVDDDPGVRASLKFSLELEGFAVDPFESGEALADMPDFPDAACLVLDYRLPGMDGLSLLALLRRRGSALPAIIITGSVSRGIRAQAARAGAMLIEKPLLCDALTAAIRLLVQNPVTPTGEMK